MMEALNSNRRNLLKKQNHFYTHKSWEMMSVKLHYINVMLSFVHQTLHSASLPPLTTANHTLIFSNLFQMNPAFIRVGISFSVCVDFFYLAYDCPSACECLCNTYCREQQKHRSSNLLHNSLCQGRLAWLVHFYGEMSPSV